MLILDDDGSPFAVSLVLRPVPQRTSLPTSRAQMTLEQGFENLEGRLLAGNDVPIVTWLAPTFVKLVSSGSALP